MPRTDGQSADWEKLGRLITQYRLELGLTLSAAARKANISNTTWRALEKGLNDTPSNATLSRVARALELDMGDVMASAGRHHDPAPRRTLAAADRHAALDALLTGDPGLDTKTRALILDLYDALVRP